MTTLQWYPAERLCSAGRERLRLVQASWFPHRFTQIVRPEERAMRWPLGACTTDEEASDRCGGAGAQSLWPEIVTEDHVLTVKWGIRAPLENVTYLFRERPCGRLSRSETVNVPVEASQAEAKLAWGVLTVSSLKLERAKPKTPEITAE